MGLYLGNARVVESHLSDQLIGGRRTNSSEGEGLTHRRAENQLIGGLRTSSSTGGRNATCDSVHRWSPTWGLYLGNAGVIQSRLSDWRSGSGCFFQFYIYMGVWF